MQQRLHRFAPPVLHDVRARQDDLGGGETRPWIEVAQTRRHAARQANGEACERSAEPLVVQRAMGFAKLRDDGEIAGLWGFGATNRGRPFHVVRENRILGDRARSFGARHREGDHGAQDRFGRVSVTLVYAKRAPDQRHHDGAGANEHQRFNASQPEFLQPREEDGGSGASRGAPTGRAIARGIRRIVRIVCSGWHRALGPERRQRHWGVHGGRDWFRWFGACGRDSHCRRSRGCSRRIKVEPELRQPRESHRSEDCFLGG